MALSSSSCSHLVELRSLFTLSVNKAFTEMTHSSMCHLWIFVPIRFPSPFTESCVSSVARVMEDTPIPSSFFVFSSSLCTQVSALLQCSIPIPPSALLTFASSILPCSVGSISTPPHHPFSISFSVELSIL